MSDNMKLRAELINLREQVNEVLITVENHLAATADLPPKRTIAAIMEDYRQAVVQALSAPPESAVRQAFSNRARQYLKELQEIEIK